MPELLRALFCFHYALSIRLTEFGTQIGRTSLYFEGPELQSRP
jgi:hypothetical protein